MSIDWECERGFVKLQQRLELFLLKFQSIWIDTRYDYVAQQDNSLFKAAAVYFLRVLVGRLKLDQSQLLSVTST